MSDSDDDLRLERAVVARLRNLGDGTSKLIFDDVLAISQSDPIAWSFESLYTSRDYSNENLDGLKLTAQ